MSKTFLHPHTQRLLRAAVAKQPHALCFVGPHGVGLRTVAEIYAEQLNKVKTIVLPEKDGAINLERGVITVEQIRELYAATQTIEPRGRVIIIDPAERMGQPAQNAFLKLLEEPTSNTQFILVAHRPEGLLPTVLSRVETLAVRPLLDEQSAELLNELGVTSEQKRTQLLFIANGLPAELTRLATNEPYFERRAAIVRDARLFLTGTAYERLLLAKKYADTRELALILLEDAMKQLRQIVVERGEMSYVSILENIQALYDAILEQGNIRLQLSSAVVL